MENQPPDKGYALAQQQDNQPAAVLPALADAVKRLKMPFFKRRLRIMIPTFSMSWIYPKFAGAVATACLAFIIVQFAIRGTENLESHSKTVIPVPAVRKHIGLPENTGSSAQQLKKTSNEAYAINSITDNGGRHAVDPFEPLFENDAPASPVKKRRAKRVPLTPMEKLDFSQLKLVAIILSDKGNSAMVEDASGKGYVLKEGTYVGRNSGRVSRILKDKVIIEEEIANNDGRLIIFQRELNLNKR
jgi:Tfp pilus assembly protein PilP